ASQAPATPPRVAVNPPAPRIQGPAVQPQAPPPQVRESVPALTPRTLPPPAPPPPPPAADPTPERAGPSAADVSTTVAAYARAIESRDMGAIRRVYPGITSEQQRGFEQFFQSARSINVTFRVTGVEVSGNSADARMSGTYEYTATGGKSERQPVSFAASLRHDGTAWRLVSVR
ncbi:MAG TPA: hypothetical protein VM939_02455, partial [Gemmatimonadaceae bacterium]|nr:hypothetical protein [Gemmatimonadaceae bacterium]